MAVEDVLSLMDGDGDIVARPAPRLTVGLCVPSIEPNAVPEGGWPVAETVADLSAVTSVGEAEVERDEKAVAVGGTHDTSVAYPAAPAAPAAPPAVAVAETHVTG